MSNVHGWTALAGAVVALAGGATTAHAAPRPQPKAKPALAVGASDTGSWRLEGRMLPVKLREPLAPRARTPRVRVIARCGDGAVETTATTDPLPQGRERFAAAGEGRALLGRRTRLVRLRLSRDVAAAATACDLTVTQPDGVVPDRTAWMRLRRGSAARCAPTAAERVVFAAAGTRVFSRSVADGAVQNAAVLRACRPGGRSVGLAESWAEENAAGSIRSNDGFVGAGRWLAWVSAERSRATPSSPKGEIMIRDLAVAGDPVATVRLGAGEQLWAISADGAAVWTGRVRTGSDGAGNPLFSTTLTASLAAGGLIELDRVAPGGTLTSVRLDADGRTLRWVADGVERSAPLPQAPAVAAGTSGAGGAAFRLAGRELTIRLRGPLLPSGARRQPLVTVVCGDDAGVAAGNEVTGWLGGLTFFAKARAAVRVDPRTTLVRARLDGDVARRTTRCAAGWRTSAGAGLVAAPMAVTSGTPFGCQVEGADPVVAETDGLIVTSASNSDAYSGSYVYRGCAKPTGRWTQVLRGTWDKYFTGSGPRLLVAKGTWLAWLYGPESGVPICTLWRLDLAAADPAPREIPLSPNFSGQLECPLQPDNHSVSPEQRDPADQPKLALAANGALAWRFSHTVSSSEAWGEINVASPGGQVTTLTRIYPSGLSLPRLSDDGRTVSWTQSDGPRSAPLPTP